MASRVRISFPEGVVFSCEVTVRTGDLNYAGHLGHDRLVALLQEARVLFLNHLGVREIDDEGRMLVVADLSVSYRAEAFAGQFLEIDIAPGDTGSRSCELLYRVTNRTTSSLVALARTGLVAVDRKRKKPTLLPEPLRAALA